MLSMPRSHGTRPLSYGAALKFDGAASKLSLSEVLRRLQKVESSGSWGKLDLDPHSFSATKSSRPRDIGELGTGSELLFVISSCRTELWQPNRDLA